MSRCNLWHMERQESSGLWVPDAKPTDPEQERLLYGPPPEPPIRLTGGTYTVVLPWAASHLKPAEIRTWAEGFAARRSIPFESLRIEFTGGSADPINPSQIGGDEPEEWSDAAKTARLNTIARLHLKSNALKGTPGNRATRRANKHGRR